VQNWSQTLHLKFQGKKRIATDFCILIFPQVRGKGLLNAIVIKEEGGVNAYDVCMKLKDAAFQHKRKVCEMSSKRW